jgi:hypothetical protein
MHAWAKQLNYRDATQPRSAAVKKRAYPARFVGVGGFRLRVVATRRKPGEIIGTCAVARSSPSPH